MKSFAANAFGLYGTADNAGERLADCFGAAREPPPDGAPLASGERCGERATHWGSFAAPPVGYAQVGWIPIDAPPDAPEIRAAWLGFRVVRRGP